MNMTTLNNGIGTRIKSRRKELKLTADTLGEMINRDRSTVYRYERNEVDNVSIKLLEEIAHCLRVTPAYLVGWETIEESDQRMLEQK